MINGASLTEKLQRLDKKMRGKETHQARGRPGGGCAAEDPALPSVPQICEADAPRVRGLFLVEPLSREFPPSSQVLEHNRARSLLGRKCPSSREGLCLPQGYWGDSGG